MLLASLLILAQVGAPPALLTSSEPWKLESEQNRCVVSRPFGSKRQLQTLFFSSDEQSDRITLIVADTLTRPVGETMATVSIDGRPSFYETFAETIHIAELKRRFTRIILDRDVSKAIFNAQRVTIASSIFSAEFALDGLPEGVPAFDACERNLIRAPVTDLALAGDIAIKSRLLSNVAKLF